jgi:hypothetical protein
MNEVFFISALKNLEKDLDGTIGDFTSLGQSLSKEQKDSVERNRKAMM